VSTSNELAEDALRRLFTDAASARNPYPLYTQLRENAPLHRAGFLPVWVMSGYPEVDQAFRTVAFGKRDELTRGFGHDLDDDQTYAFMSKHSIVRQNPPDHTRLKGLISREFTSRRVQNMRPGIEATTKQLLDRIEDHGDFDLMRVLAFPLPVRVLGDLLGIPEPDQAQFRDLTVSITKLIDPSSTPAEVERGKSDCLVMERYFLDLIEARRRRPADDLTTALIGVRDGEDRITEDELLATIMVLFFGGVETTTNVLGSMVLTLLEHPDQLAAVRADRSLVPGAVEETLRFHSPTQTTARTVLEPAEVNGISLVEGAVVLTMLGAANRDPRRYDDPDRFDITRRDTHHVAFAAGLHYCIGAALAKLEADVALNAILDRYSDLELLDLEPDWRPNVTMRGLDTLRLRGRPA
jgi:hypothetical protein